MNESHTGRETCSCGAEIVVTSNYAAHNVQERLKEFREAHVLCRAEEAEAALKEAEAERDKLRAGIKKHRREKFPITNADKALHSLLPDTDK